MKIRLILLLTTALTAMTGCSSGGTASGGNNFGLSGGWTGIIESYRVSGPTGSIQYAGTINLNMVQDVAGNISGLVTVSDHDTHCWSGGEITDGSSLTGNSIIFGWTDQSGATVSAQGTATNNTIQALYTSTESSVSTGEGEAEATTTTCVASSGAISLRRT